MGDGKDGERKGGGGGEEVRKVGSQEDIRRGREEEGKGREGR